MNNRCETCRGKGWVRAERRGSHKSRAKCWDCGGLGRKETYGPTNEALNRRIAEMWGQMR